MLEPEQLIDLAKTLGFSAGRVARGDLSNPFHPEQRVDGKSLEYYSAFCQGAKSALTAVADLVGEKREVVKAYEDAWGEAFNKGP